MGREARKKGGAPVAMQQAGKETQAQGLEGRIEGGSGCGLSGRGGRGRGGGGPGCSLQALHFSERVHLERLWEEEG